MGYATNRSGAAWGACPAPRQGGVGAGLVDEDEIRRHERGDLVPPSGTGGVIAFGGDERLFLSGQPARPSARDIVAGLTQTPVIAAHCGTVLSQRGIRGGTNLGHEGWLGLSGDPSRPPGPGRGGHRAGLAVPLAPSLDRAEPDAEETGRLGLGKAGVDGSHQPLAEVGRVL